jgi:hypothetical protein
MSHYQCRAAVWPGPESDHRDGPTWTWGPPRHPTSSHVPLAGPGLEVEVWVRPDGGGGAGCSAAGQGGAGRGTSQPPPAQPVRVSTRPTAAVRSHRPARWAAASSESHRQRRGCRFAVAAHVR